MIYEFALDPSLVARWADPKAYAFFRETFGPDSARIGSAYPNEWRRQVIEEFQHAFPGSHRDSLPRRRLDTLLDALVPGMLKRDAVGKQRDTWLECAECEHAERPFRGIVSLSNPRRHKEVITPEDLSGEQLPEAWTIPPNPVPPRTAAEFAAAVAPLLKTARRVAFIDPHFRAGELRFRRALEAMLSVLWNDNCCCASPRAELLLSESKPDSAAWLVQQCVTYLPRVIPPGRNLEVTVLRKRGGGERLHNRYILTKLAGVTFGIGLDVADDSEPGQTDDLCRLSSVQLRKRWGQYVSARPSHFDVAAGPVKIGAYGREGGI